MSKELTNTLVVEIRDILDTARKNVAREINNELIISYWKIGEIIVRYEQNDSIRAAYGEQTLKQLSKALTAEFGRGFSRSNLQNMRSFYLEYEKCQSVTGKLTWTHYCELLSISDKDKRSFYEKEAINSNCTDKDALTAEYALGGLSNNIFASKYTYYIPEKEQLIAEVEKVINRWNERNEDE